SADVIEPFEQIKHYSEPVITKSLEVKEQKDLPKLIEALRAISKEDPTIKIHLNQDTGEHLVSGNGELHLEIIEYKIQVERKIPLAASPQMVVHREPFRGKPRGVEEKSPKKQNRLKISVEPLEPEIIKAIEDGVVKEGRPKGREVWEKLVELGMD